MSSRTFPLTQIAGQSVTPVQQQYLDGFFAGIAARGLSFGDVQADPVPAPDAVDDEDLTIEESIKKALNPLDFYPNILQYAATNTPPEKEDIFRYKWSGLFYLSPIKGAFMARLRIPGGVLKILAAPRDHHPLQSPGPPDRTERRPGIPPPHPKRGTAHQRPGGRQHPQPDDRAGRRF